MTISRSVLAGTALAVATVVATPALAWEKIGSREVSRAVERDEVTVRGDERHTKLKLCVRRNPVRFHDLDLVFANGAHQDVQIRDIIHAGACSRVIDFKGGHRNLQRVIVIYDTAGSDRRRAVVNFFAQ